MTSSKVKVLFLYSALLSSVFLITLSSIVYNLFHFLFIQISKITLSRKLYEFFNQDLGTANMIENQFYNTNSFDPNLVGNDPELVASVWNILNSAYNPNIVWLILIVFTIAYYALISFNGWSVLKKNVIAIESIENSSPQRNNIQYYLGPETYSYGIVKKKIVLSPSTYTQLESNVGRFAMEHEKFHLIMRDSVFKNTYMNFNFIEFPIVSFTLLITPLSELISLSGILPKNVASLMGGSNSLLKTWVLFIAYSLILLCFHKLLDYFILLFSKTKEFLADLYAVRDLNAAERNTLVQTVAFQQDKYHPSPVERSSNIIKESMLENSISFLPFILLIFCTNIFTFLLYSIDPFKEYLLFSVLFLFIYDAITFNLFKKSIKDQILIVGFFCLCMALEFLYSYLQSGNIPIPIPANYFKSFLFLAVIIFVSTMKNKEHNENI